MLTRGVPALLQIDPDLDLDALREKFAFEIVAEEEDGFVIVASEDIDLAALVQMAGQFAENVHGSAAISQIYELADDPNQRLQRILSDRLWGIWPTIEDTQDFIVDVSIACTGTQEIPTPPVRGKRDTDAAWAHKEHEWSTARTCAYEAWDELKREREDAIERIAAHYDAEIYHQIDNASFDAPSLPDSFSVRIQISGKGLRDLVQNYPYVFEVLEPDDIELPQAHLPPAAAAELPIPAAPDPAAPAVCIIDSGIQEQHALLAPAIDAASSYCFLPGQPRAVGDFVRPGGHGTRVSGAVLYGEAIPRSGYVKLPFWIQNARVLNENCKLPEALYPPAVLSAAIQRFHSGARKTRIFNHSINAAAPCRTRHMSAWAAEIDALSADLDILVIQSVGNVLATGTGPVPGVQDHLGAGRDYPDYLRESSVRVANPAQSLQALTVGSIAYGTFHDEAWQTFAGEPGRPSAFSRTGPGIWDVIKPELVEYGGDLGRHAGTVRIPGPPQACPELVRSTMFPPGPPYDRDQVGTSYAAPKVARIAANVQAILPDEPALLYRALIVQSARWPEWAENLLLQIRQLPSCPEREALKEHASNAIRSLGYGLPDVARATSNSDYRTTFITHGTAAVRPGEAHIYQVRVPPELRAPGAEFEIRIEVTLSYAAQPRRTRRRLRRYLSTWADWKTSNREEDFNSFRARALKEAGAGESSQHGQSLPWALQSRSEHGDIRGVKRSSGTVQKDWAVIASHSLPSDFCIAVIGHKGWSRDPDSTARYSLVVSFEALGQQVMIYDALRAAMVEVPEVEAESEVEIEP